MAQGPDYIFANIGKAQESVQKLINQAIESAKGELRENENRTLREALIGASGSMMQSGDSSAAKFNDEVLAFLGLPHDSADLSLRGKDAIARLEKTS
jgi:hypothetical protein